MCDLETLEPCNEDDCEGIIEIDTDGLDQDCFFCNKVDCICDELTDRYKEQDLF